MDEAAERERLSWAEFGAAARELARQVADDGYEPDLVLSIARGGLLVGAALGYALDVKNTWTMNVEFYTGVDERLDVPMILPPVPELVDLESARMLIADDVADTGETLAAREGLLRGEGRRGALRRALREVALGRQVRVRLAAHRSLDRLPVERRGSDRARARDGVDGSTQAARMGSPGGLACNPGRARAALASHCLPSIVVDRGTTDPRSGYGLRLRRQASRRAGKRMTSRIVSRPESSMTRRSMPSPRPPVGGMPYESAST